MAEATHPSKRISAAKILLLASASLVAITAFSPAFATVPTDFLSFTTAGSLSGWTTNGTVTTTNSTDHLTLTNPNTGVHASFQLTPAANEYMAKMFPSNLATACLTSTSCSNVDAVLGLTSGTLSGLFNPLPTAGTQNNRATNFAYMTGMFSLSAGSHTFYWAYASGDYPAYNDGALFSINGAGTQTVSVLASTGATDNKTGGAQPETVVVGATGTTQWTAYTFTLASAATYQVSFAAYNWGDTDYTYVPVFYIGASQGSLINDSTHPIDTNSDYYNATDLNSSVAPDFKGGTLRVNQPSAISSDFLVESYSSNAIDAHGYSGVFSGAMSGTGGLTIKDSIGGGKIIFTGANTYTGGTTIDSDATLQLGIGGTTGSLAGNITNNGSLIFNRSDAVTFSNVISGSGALTVANGTLVLTGANTYTGGTTINSGTTLQIGNGEAAGSITGNILNNGSLLFKRSDTVTFANVISGSGALTVANGTLVLTGTNTYTGGTTINSGATLQIGNGGTTGSIVSNVVNQGILAFNRSDTVVFNGTVTGNGTLVQTGTGKVIVTTNYTGKTIVNSGTLQIGNGATSGTVVGNIVNNATVVYGQSATTIYNGIISGTGGLSVAGGGIVILNGANTYTGATTVTAGALIVGDGVHPVSQILGSVTVSGNAIVGGYGVIGGNLSATGGVISPGNSIGTLTVAGNYTQSANTTLKIEVAPTASDKLVVLGKAQLDGTLAISLQPGAAGTSLYPILTAGSISGTFSSVTYTGNDNGMAYGVIYGTHEVDLAATPKTSGQIYGDIVTQSLDSAMELNSATIDHLNSTTTTGWSIWGKSLTSTSHTDGKGNLADFNTQVWGVISGADYQSSRGNKVTGVFSYTHNQLGVHGENDKATIEGYFFSLAGHIPTDRIIFDLTGFVQHNSIDVSRLNGGIGDAIGSTGNFVGGGSVQASYPVLGGDLTPFTRLTIAGVGTETFTETGPLGFTVASQTRTSVRGSLGVDASHTFQSAYGMQILPHLRLGVEGEFGTTKRGTGVTFASTDFTTPAPSPSRVSALLGAGITAAFENRLQISLEANGRVSSSQYSGVVSFGAKYKF